MSDPANLKTIGQFILMGDASLHPCALPENVAANASIGAVDATTQRKAIRLALASKGQSVVASASAMGKPIDARSRVTGYAELQARVRELASQHGLETPEVTTYRVSGGRAFMNSVKAMGAAPFVTVAVETKKNEHVPDVRLVVAHSLYQEDEHAISFFRTYVSR
jgi:hypothetical protein